MSVKSKVCATCDKAKELPVIGGLLKSKPKVAIIRLSGVIADSGVRRGGISHSKYEKLIEDAFDTYNLKAVALIINSPGGSPAQSALVADHIRRKATEKDVPVYAFVEDVAASGGYWLACAADEIYANAASIVGSIGVISASFGFQELIKNHGIERRIQTAGKDKSFMDPFVDIKPEDVKRLKDLQGDLHEGFIAWVKERRGEKLEGKDATLFSGAFWTAKKAVGLGLIDGMGEAKSWCREHFKDEFQDEIKFAEFSPDKKLVPSLLGADVRASLAEDAIDAIETKAVWGRYGL